MIFFFLFQHTQYALLVQLYFINHKTHPSVLCFTGRELKISACYYEVNIITPHVLADLHIISSGDNS